MEINSCFLSRSSKWFEKAKLSVSMSLKPYITTNFCGMAVALQTTVGFLEKNATRIFYLKKTRFSLFWLFCSFLAGILSQGLRIAPPEAPVTGYMFGKGVYFAGKISSDEFVSTFQCCLCRWANILLEYSIPVFFLADMVSKSANYCATSRNNPTGLMLLSDVALGNMYGIDWLIKSIVLFWIFIGLSKSY